MRQNHSRRIDLFHVSSVPTSFSYRTRMRKNLARRTEFLRVSSLEPRESDKMRLENESLRRRTKWQKRRNAFRLGT